jgi:hypothetical protein
MVDNICDEIPDQWIHSLFDKEGLETIPCVWEQGVSNEADRAGRALNIKQ